MFEKSSTILEIDEKEFIGILRDYFSRKMDKRISIEKLLSIKYKEASDMFISVPNIDLYVTEEDEHHLHTWLLSQKDIEEALDDYATSIGYNFISYKNIGGIHHVGYTYDEDTPYFEGVVVNVKERVMERILK